MSIESYREVYTSLSQIYDDVMREVDYEGWADYIDDLICHHHPEAETILELACGTGTLALYLDELECYSITATDFSDSMLDVARQKAAITGSDITFQQADCKNIDVEASYDVVVMLFDSINYMMTLSDVKKTLHEVRKVLNPGGIFIFDFTTPRYSPKIARKLNNETRITADHLKYIRTSHYDSVNRIHSNEFRICQLACESGKVEHENREIHQQKIYTFDEIKSVVGETDFAIKAAYDEFAWDEATSRSDRINMILQ